MYYVDPITGAHTNNLSKSSADKYNPSFVKTTSEINKMTSFWVKNL